MFDVKHFDFDIIVVGGGHAGVEAALAGSRMGKKVALMTMDRTKLALMSCNPAIGGLGKSHIVKEVDALGGLMGRVIDATGIQFRKLNLSRGPAVWSTRAQADRIAYTRFVSEFVMSDRNIIIIEAIAGALLVEGSRVAGIETEDGEIVFGKAVILCTGTFLGGLIHIGDKKIESGRRNEKAAYKLSDSLRKLGFEVGRLKTGTPPRLDGRTIDYSRCQMQPGDYPIPFFSHATVARYFDQANCHLTYTTDKTKEIIGQNLTRSPLFSGQIKSRGPRYCPSIEDKIYRFSDKPRHQIFLEPEGNGTDEVYPNGFSTSLPEVIQREAIRSVIGLEKAEITKPGYAIEYDYCPSHQVKSSLETKRIDGLFLAGQINGTSGYEEAAGLGLMAGINAVLKLNNEPPFVLDRAESYLGVMIDDLITHSTTEPYRMFTSRAEYRLGIREDNVCERLFGYAQKYGLISNDNLDQFGRLQMEVKQSLKWLKETSIPVSRLDGMGRHFVKREVVTLADLLKVPKVELKDILPLMGNFIENHSISQQAMEKASIFIKYDGYIRKQKREVEKFRKMEKELIPSDLDFSALTGLRNEAKEKFHKFQPRSLGQAGRIEGVTIGDLTVLAIHVRKHCLNNAKLVER